MKLNVTLFRTWPDFQNLTFIWLIKFICVRVILWLSRFHEYLHLLTFSPVGTDEEMNIHSETLNTFKNKHYSMIRQAMSQLFVLCTTLQPTIMYTNPIIANYKDR